MTNLTDSPLRDEQLPFEPMSNVIDALKRLERLGDEQSKTIEKLLEAARILSSTIAERFNTSGDETITLIDKSLLFKRRDSLPPPPVTDIYGSPVEQGQRFHYWLERGEMGLRLVSDFGYVAANRSNALQFAKDVADGLLDAMTEAVTRQQTEYLNALATLQRASTEIKEASQGATESNETVHEVLRRAAKSFNDPKLHEAMRRGVESLNDPKLHEAVRRAAESLSQVQAKFLINLR